MRAETNKIWETVLEMVPDKYLFSVLLLPNDFNNLKTCIKATITEKEPEKFLIPFGTIDPKLMLSAIKDKNYDLLPEYIKDVARKAFEAFLRTGDSQFCDTLIDNCLLKSMEEIALNSDVNLIREYSELFVAVSNIKIAVRSSKTNKKIEFLNKAMAECKSLDVKTLIDATIKGPESIYEYLSTTVYSEAIPYLKNSMVLFEKWYDDKVMDLIKKEKSNPFTIAPIIAYVLARQNEIKVVRMIFSGKRNNISDDIIKERLRFLYV